MMSTRLVVAGLLAFFLVACGQNSTGNDGGNGGRPGNGGEAKYTDTGFSITETDSQNTVIAGTMDLTFSNGQVSAKLTAAPGSKFSNDTGTLSGTYQYQGKTETLYGEGSIYTADLQLDFDKGPEYTASGRFFEIDNSSVSFVGTSEEMVLSKDGSEVGTFFFFGVDDSR